MNIQTIPAVPRFKTILNSARFVRNPISVLSENTENYGATYHTYIGGVFPAILSTDAGFIQHVLQKNHRNYKKSPIHFEKLGHFLGNGLLTSDGEYWLRQRRLIQPGFHRDRLAGLTDIMNGVLDDFIASFDRRIAQRQPIDISENMLEVAFRIIARSLFSTDVGEEELEKLSGNITRIQEFLARQIRQPFKEGWFRLSGQVRRHEKLAAESDEIILKYIRERKESGNKQDDLLQMLLDARYEDTGEGMNEKQLLDETLILFVAGHETSANALTWTWYLLSQHPEAVVKIRREIVEKIGDRPPEFADLPKLEYLTQVIEESMRLYPPAWITDRVAVDDDQYNGIDIPKGIAVVTYIYGAHHSPDYWPEPEKFIPERFSKENKKKQAPFSYLPFGGGPRLCIGNNFAMMEMQLALARLVPRYDFRLVEGQSVELQPLITLRPKDGIRMRFQIGAGH
jgi:cytochrome P450